MTQKLLHKFQRLRDLSLLKTPAVLIAVSEDRGLCSTLHMGCLMERHKCEGRSLVIAEPLVSFPQAYLYLVFPHLILILMVFCCLQALLTQKQEQNTKCTCKERNALLPFRAASVSEPWEMGGVTTRSGRVSNGNWKENSRKPVPQLTAECFSICKAVLNPQETLRINFLLSFLSA